MIYNGELRRMPAKLNVQNQAEYEMLLVDTASEKEIRFDLNPLVGSNLTIRFTGEIFCKNCGRKTNRSFAQGFCYPCFRNAPENSECIIHPELCRAHLGEGRDPEWEELYHNKPHYVYLAATDKIKVGVTNSDQIPVRWIDQGAASAIKLAKTPNRYLAGVMEVALKETFDDKTNWRSMLRNIVDEDIDLEEAKRELEALLPDDLSRYITDEDDLTAIEYPVLEYPVKLNAFNVENESVMEGKLMGIKGQYLIFDEGRVINVRRYAGYRVEFDTKPALFTQATIDF